jgi:hypothetical protein
VHGWGASQAKVVDVVDVVDLAGCREGRVDVTLGPAGEGVEFRASSVSLGRVRPYLAWIGAR